jgi:alpha-L-fucosidase 2
LPAPYSFSRLRKQNEKRRDFECCFLQVVLLRMKNTILWFKKPAEKWIQSLPAGNGHIGCMIYNDPFCDKLCLNDDTLWSGYERDYCKKDFKENILKVRDLMVKGKRAQAEEIVEAELTNRFTQAYLPLGYIIIKSEEGKVLKYRRELNMSKGIIFSRYIKNGIGVKTETFVSYSDDVLIHTIESKEPAVFEISFKSKIRHHALFDKNGFLVTGHAPSDITVTDVSDFYSEGNTISYDEVEKSIKFAARAEIISDGNIIAFPDRLSVTDAMKITLVYSSATSFNKGKEYKQYCIETVLYASGKGIYAIRNAHINDHASLFERMNIDLGGDDVSCDERYARMRRGEINNSDISMLFQFGRYLLIGASRKGTQAANLQGIWNKDLIPPWWSGYTLNINLQMNYWLADRANLSCCFDPLVGFVKRLCKAGKRTASEDYGTEGAVAHHQSDIWAHSTPVGNDKQRIPASARWAMWNMSLPWLCIQLFDHYLYTRDEDFLKSELLPVMKDAADFMMCNFSEIDGKLYNIPTTSPENMYFDETGNELAICNISAMDIGITREFFAAYVFACKRVGDYDEADRCAGFADLIADYSVSKYGGLNEWDKEFEETEKGHRHFSMLFGAYPASHLLNSPFNDAAKKSLCRRLQSGSGQTGWSAIWAVALLARFGEGEAAYEIIKKLMSENIHENMFGAHPPDIFQIDANYGFTAAICELILQEYNGVVKLLPALPKAIENGSILGLKLYSGHTISLKWKASKVIYMEMCAKNDDEIVIDARYLISDRGDYRPCPEGIKISLKEGNMYRFYFKNVSKIKPGSQENHA